MDKCNIDKKDIKELLRVDFIDHRVVKFNALIPHVENVRLIPLHMIQELKKEIFEEP